MRIVIAKCSIAYTGRGGTTRGESIRAIIIKKDGAVSIHRDASNKPLNYMGKGSIFTESTDLDSDGHELIVWKFDTRDDTITVHIREIISDSDFEITEEDEGFIQDGTEHHLQAWLADNPTALGGNYEFIAREFQTGEGPVDLLVRDMDGQYIAVEVKRVANTGAVSQVKKYVDAMKELPGYENVRGLIAALDIRPKTLVRAEKHGFSCHVIDADWKTYRDTADPTSILE